MKRLIFTLTMVFATLSVFSQGEVGKMTFIPKVGVNLATASASDMYYLDDGIGNKELKTKMRIGVAAGIDAEYQLSQPVSLSAGIMYSLQGHGYDDIEFQKSYSATLHTVNVPILVSFYITKGLAIKAGLQPGYAFYKKTSYDKKIGNSWGSYNTSGTNYANFDFTIPVGVAYDFDKVRVDLRYNFGLANINKLGDGKLNTRVIQATIGYKL